MDVMGPLGMLASFRSVCSSSSHLGPPCPPTHHTQNPDNQEQAQAKFQEVSQAFETLSDPEKRKVCMDAWWEKRSV